MMKNCEISIIPEYLKSFFTEKDIAQYYNPTSKEPSSFNIFLSSYGNSKFEKVVCNISHYLGIRRQDLQSILVEQENPVQLLLNKGVIPDLTNVKKTKYGDKYLNYNSKAEADEAVNNINKFLVSEYQQLEAQIKIKMLLKGTDLREFTDHNVIFTSRTLAEHFKKEYDIPYFFRTLELVDVKNESSYVIEAKVKFYTEVCGQCHLCGNPLTDEFSQKTGIGPVCAKKKLGIKRTKIENIESVISQIQAISEDIGEIGPIIIPKKQISRIR